ncbi:conserved hypothetical protein [Talaromyces stipitatus ATCC 10500]|uniref:Exonuclease V n=1 Tax=Talaromyces stipitatus (strain ATCC 10500 / CBS 375.48 / QM 6759 / NRRL 1006) TaxID=441959 RepID=B8M0T8_TALSN|nr:uncharacterized protein TSTA_087040 [Talaromyces stipitatus ATCC 10500]EED21471.1 conserved hypothetical protein [Talaromyces stipitatus ATCC 10500]
MSCPAKQIDMRSNNIDDNSSDYGCEFTPDEEELLNDLLARVAAPAILTTNPPTTTTEETPSEIPQEFIKEVLDDLQPLSDPLIVSDIEDYEVPHAARFPRVLGREAWSPARKWGWQQKQNSTTIARKLWSSRAVDVHAEVVEREGSPEGRERDRERQRNREKEWTAVENQERSDSQTESTSNNNNNNDEDNAVANHQEQSPIQRFRKPPNKAFSVSDLISPAWCELQYWYTLTKHGRKRRTPAMMQGSAVHKVLEDEVHTTVPVDITTKEDGWALRIWNVVQGLRTLRQYGLTRELEVWGLVEGEIVTGIIDQLSYVCPDPKLEASAAQHYTEMEAARAALPEYQMSISDYFITSGAGKPLDEMWKQQPEEPVTNKDVDDDYGTDLDQSYLDVPRIYITDIKTRASRSVPTVKSTGFRPTHLQLQLYYHMLNRSVTSDDVTMEMIAKRYDLDPERTFSDAFIAEVGGLNEEYYDASSTLSSDPDYIPGGSSQDSVSILLSHNNLHSLWDLMKKHLRYTFLPTLHNQNIAPSIPAATQPASLALYPTVLSPVLTAKYLSSTKASEDGVPDELGSRSFLFDPSDLTSYTSDQLSWWRGERAPRGVEVFDAWKCRICDFREECDWRISKEYEFATRRRRLSKTAMEMLGQV